jgi:hypothetical protein
VEYEAALGGDALHVAHSEVFAQQGYCEKTDDHQHAEDPIWHRLLFTHFPDIAVILRVAQ